MVATIFRLSTIGPAMMLSLLTVPALSRAQTSDEQIARIQTVIQSITVCVDLRRFDLLDRFYAEEVVADYSSLWGTEPRKLTGSEVGATWAGFIPGFDTTRHEISNIEVHISGRNANASASADVIASHWLDDETWIIRGAYLFELAKRSNDWVVSGWKFVLESESGDRSLVDVAEARASQNGGPNDM
jgi:hypothetical protein